MAAAGRGDGSQGLPARARLMASWAVMPQATAESRQDAAPAGQGGLGVPVAGDGLVPLGGLGALLADVIGLVHGGLTGEQPDLAREVTQPAAQDVARVVPIVPVPQPVVKPDRVRCLTRPPRVAGTTVGTECLPTVYLAHRPVPLANAMPIPGYQTR